MAWLVVREGLLDRLRETRGITSHEAMARLAGVSLATYNRARAGDRVSAQLVADLALAFGLGIGEIARPVYEADEQRAAS